MMTSRALRYSNLRSLIRQQGQQQQVYAPICRTLHLSTQPLTTSQSLHHIGPKPCLVHSKRAISVSTIQRQEERQSKEEEEEQREQTSGEKDIEEILQKEFSPKHLQVQDVSGGCGSFYAIIIASSRFKGITTVKAHRLVNSALKDIIKDIHGLQLRTIPADE